MPSFTLSLSGGSNNRAPDNRIPKGQARSIVNAVARADGSLSLAPGSQRVIAGRIAGAIGFGRRIVVSTQSALAVYDTETGESTQLYLSSAAPLAGAELNGSLYLCAGADAWRVTQQLELKPWALLQPRFAVSAGAGNLPAGRYAVACAALEDGIEHAPSAAQFIDLPDGAGISITISSGDDAQVYISRANGQSLYLQRAVPAGSTALIDALRDDTAPMRFAGYTPPPRGHTVCAVGSQLAIASGRFVYLTAPQMPHLHDPISGWLAYPSAVTGMASDGRTLYVNADKLYAVTGLDTPEPVQSVVSERPAIPGSLVAMIDGGVCALTELGPLVAQGETSLPSRDSFAVRATAESAGVQLDADGDRLLLFSRRGQQSTNRLQAISARGRE